MACRFPPESTEFDVRAGTSGHLDSKAKSSQATNARIDTPPHEKQKTALEGAVPCNCRLAC
jgi:hypothetical protein